MEFMWFQIAEADLKYVFSTRGNDVVWVIEKELQHLSYGEFIELLSADDTVKSVVINVVTDGSKCAVIAGLSRYRNFYVICYGHLCHDMSYVTT